MIITKLNFDQLNSSCDKVNSGEALGNKIGNAQMSSIGGGGCGRVWLLVNGYLDNHQDIS